MTMLTNGQVLRRDSSDASRTTTMSSTGPLDEMLSLNIAVDGCIVLYHGAAHRYVAQIADLRDRIATLSQMLDETRRNENEVRYCERLQADGLLAELKIGLAERFGVLQRRSREMARKQMWYRAVALNERRYRLLNWMLLGIFQTLAVIGHSGFCNRSAALTTILHFHSNRAPTAHSLPSCRKCT